MFLHNLIPTLLTVLASTIGGGVATLLGLPAGWLMGGALAVTAAAMAGMPVRMPDRLRDLAFLLIGMSMGASVARDSLSLIASWPVSLMALAAGCAAVGLVFVRLKVPAGFVLGAMAAATAAKLGGLYADAMPTPLVTVTFILTGALIGSRFAGITRAEFFAAAKGGIIATGMTVGIVTVIAYGVSLVIDMPFGQIWLGLSPGALEGMGALGIALGYDTAFIAAHHVIRLLLLSFAIPTVVLLIRRREAAAIAKQSNKQILE